MGKTLFGYTHVDGIPNCPCNNPGNYVMAEERGNDPLDFLLRCWCGRSNEGRFDDLKEKEEFVSKNSKRT